MIGSRFMLPGQNDGKD